VVRNEWWTWRGNAPRVLLKLQTEHYTLVPGFLFHIRRRPWAGFSEVLLLTFSRPPSIRYSGRPACCTFQRCVSGRPKPSEEPCLSTDLKRQPYQALSWLRLLPDQAAARAKDGRPGKLRTGFACTCLIGVLGGQRSSSACILSTPPAIESIHAR